MPLTVGNFHLWQLPDLSSPQPESSIEFTELENDLSDGYFAQSLFGSNNGLRSWRLSCPTLVSLEIPVPTVTDINGAVVSRMDYLWNLFIESKVTGQPFAYADPDTGQYYLVRFADKRLTRQRMRVKLYSTGVELKQVRVLGATVFDPAIVPGVNYWYNETSHGTVGTPPDWNPVPPGVNILDATGDVTYGTATQNGLPVVQFNSVAGNNGRAYFLGLSTWTDIFLVMKVRTATFEQTSGVLCEDDAGGGFSQQWLLGENGTTKFSDVPSGTTTPVMLDSEYRLNGVLYPLDDMQAPMQQWGVVHLRFLNGARIQPDSPGLIDIGWNGGLPGNHAEIDVAEFIGTIAPLGATNIPMSTAREITEHLLVKWAVTT